MAVKTEMKKYKFPQYASKKLKHWNVTDLAVRDMAGGACVFYNPANPEAEVAYISILEVYSWSICNNNTIQVYDTGWLATILQLLKEWKTYYGYPRDLVIGLQEYKEI